VRTEQPWCTHFQNISLFRTAEQLIVDDALPAILQANVIETATSHLLLSADIARQISGACLLKELAKDGKLSCRSCRVVSDNAVTGEARATLLGTEAIRALAKMRDRSGRGSQSRAIAADTLAELDQHGKPPNFP